VQPITVRLSGDFYLNEPLTVGYQGQMAADGYTVRNVTFESYGDTRARLIGGRRLKGFVRDTFNGVPCVSLHIPDVQAGKWRFTDLYVNGRRASLARYPKTGTLRAVTTERPNSAVYKLADGSKWFVAKKEDIADLAGIEDAIVSFYHYWVDEHSPVESYDKETGKIVMAYRSRFKMTNNYGVNDPSEFCYYLENISATFGSPNEWYLDVAHGMLYYVPEDMDADIDALEVYAPTVEQIVRVGGVSGAPVTGIRFRGLDFLCSRGDYASVAKDPMDIGEKATVSYASDPQSAALAYGAIRFEYAENCAVEDCRFSLLGLHAVEISRGCRRIRVERSLFEELGGGGVKIFGATAKEAEEGITTACAVRGNIIRRIGRRYAAACGILVCHSSYNEIEDNEISYTDYTGISVGWVWGYFKSSTYGNIIRRNHVHHIGVGLLSDMAGIYLLGVQSGTVVEDNIVHDVISAHYGGHGIYPDEGSSFLTIERNVVYNCKSYCYYQHYGANNTVRDNIFAFGEQGVVLLGKGEAHASSFLEGNALITRGDAPIYRVQGAGINLRTSRNYIWRVDGDAPVVFLQSPAIAPEGIGFAEWKRDFGQDEGSEIALPDWVEVDADSGTVGRK
jgi:hypothetical protein